MRSGNCEWKKENAPCQNRELLSLSEMYFALNGLKDLTLQSKLERCNSKSERDDYQKERNDKEYEGEPQVFDQKLRLEPVIIEEFIDALIFID